MSFQSENNEPDLKPPSESSIPCPNKLDASDDDDAGNLEDKGKEKYTSSEEETEDESQSESKDHNQNVTNTKNMNVTKLPAHGFSPSSLDLLVRLFPEKKKSVLELVLKRCGDDLLKAIEQCVPLGNAYINNRHKTGHPDGMYCSSANGGKARKTLRQLVSSYEVPTYEVYSGITY